MLGDRSHNLYRTYTGLAIATLPQGAGELFRDLPPQDGWPKQRRGIKAGATEATAGFPEKYGLSHTFSNFTILSPLAFHTYLHTFL